MQQQKQPAPSLADRRRARKPVIGEDDMSSQLDNLKAQLEVVNEDQEEIDEDDGMDLDDRIEEEIWQMQEEHEEDMRHWQGEC